MTPKPLKLNFNRSCSRCVDSGSPDWEPDPDDLYNTSFIIQGEPGVDEGTCPWDCQTSAGGPDGNVGINDLLDLLGQWNAIGGSCDLGEGAPGAGIEEFLKILANWGPCPK